jgi:nicotinate phosphoribosyltransferase
VVNGVYKLVADEAREGWRGVWKRSPGKETLPGPKQVFRLYEGERMGGDVIAAADEKLDGEPLLVPAMRSGERVHRESLGEVRARVDSQLAAIPEHLRLKTETDEPYRVTYSEQLREKPAG